MNIKSVLFFPDALCYDDRCSKGGKAWRENKTLQGKENKHEVKAEHSKETKATETEARETR